MEKYDLQNLIALLEYFNFSQFLCIACKIFVQFLHATLILQSNYSKCVHVEYAYMHICMHICATCAFSKKHFTCCTLLTRWSDLVLKVGVSYGCWNIKTKLIHSVSGSNFVPLLQSCIAIELKYI